MQYVFSITAILFSIWGSSGKAYADQSAIHHEESSEYAEERSVRNPFKQEVKAYDPLLKRKTDGVLIGPAFKARRSDDFDYYRYVTFYDVEKRTERIYSLGVLREECFDAKGKEKVGEYTYAYMVGTKVKAGVDISGIGLGVELEETRTLEISRSIPPTGGIVAEYIPYAQKENWYGQTYIQTYSNKTGKEEFIKQRLVRVSDLLLMQLVFPFIMPNQKYPMEFEVQDAAWSLVIEQKILSHCGGSSKKKTKH